MFFRKYWIPLLVFIVAIVGVSLYVLQTRPPKEPIKIYKVVEPEKPTEQPTTQAPVGDTSQGGHIHADGTWHEGPHETPQPPAQRTRQQVNASAPRQLPEDVFSAEYTAQVKAAVQTCVSNFPTSGDEQKIAAMDEAYGQFIDARNDAGRLSRLAYETKNPSYQARADEIYALLEPFYAIIPKPKLNSDQLSQVEKAAQEFEAITQRLSPAEQQRLRDLGIANPYRTRLEEEQNR